MADIRKRKGAKGVTYQVRYPSKSSTSGYAYATFDTLKEARDFREDSRKRERNAPASAEVRTVPQAIDKWLDICAKEGRDGRDPVTAGTLQNYEYRAEIIKTYDWPKQLHELAAPDVVNFRSWLLQNHSRVVAHKALSSLHSMILEMVHRGVLAHDFAAGISIRNNSRYDEPVTIPTEKEVQDLLAAADRLANSKNQQIANTWRRYRPMLYLAADSGMRPQEYIVLPRANVTDTGVKVDRALERMGGISVTKTPAGRRFINLSPNTLDMVRHYIEKHAPKSKYDLAFPAKNGNWQTPANWRNYGFYVACSEAGLVESVKKDGKVTETPRFRPYDLRHFYASMLIEQRVNLKRIQHLMGHEDIRTTLDVYGHIIERVEANTEHSTGLLSSLRPVRCGESVASAI